MYTQKLDSGTEFGINMSDGMTVTAILTATLIFGTFHNDSDISY